MAVDNKDIAYTPSHTNSERPEQKAEQLRKDAAPARSPLSEDAKASSEAPKSGLLKTGSLKEEAKEIKHVVRDAKDAAFDSLRHAKDQAFESISDGVEQVSDRARVAGHTVSDFVATHAIPLTLLGAGAGWLLVSMSNQRRASAPSYLRSGRYDDDQGLLGNVRERAGEISERATSAIARTSHRIADRAHDLQSDLGDRAAELSTQVKSGANYVGQEAAELGRQAYDGIEWAGTRAVEVSERNPLAVGLVALAAGAAVAWMLPPTRRENELLGQTRDRLMQSAQRSANQLKNSVQESVQRTASDVREVIGEISNPGSSHA